MSLINPIIWEQIINSASTEQKKNSFYTQVSRAKVSAQKCRVTMLGTIEICNDKSDVSKMYYGYGKNQRQRFMISLV